MKKTFILSFLLLTSSLFAGAQMRYLQGSLQGSQEVPSNASAARGTVIVRYNTATNYLDLNGDYQNLSAAATAAHIHGPAAIGVNASVLFSLNTTGGTTGILSGNATLTETQEAQLLAGNMYVNVHNSTFPGGEIRAQLSATTAGQSFFLAGKLQGAQSVPPNGSTATGNAAALLDRSTNTIYVTANFTGLTADITATHIHSGAAGSNGPVSISLLASGTTSGTITGTAVITATLADEIIAGNSYLNIHNATYPGGEIRAQMTNLAQQRFLGGNLQGTQEVPANGSSAKGTVIVKYNTDTRLLELIGDYQGLTAAATAAHIHGPAPAGTNASVLFSLTNTGGIMGTLTGTVTLTQVQEADLLNGLMYVNVHNSTYPGGEIRGQLIPTTSGETQYLTGSIQGSQSVPAITSSGTGTATVLLDKITRDIYVTASYSNLSAGITNAHIHRAPAGVNGPVSINLSFMSGTISGTVTGSATAIRSTLADSIINGFSYLNIHTSTYPGGEIRAQLGNLTLPVILKSFNGFKDRNQVALIWQTEQEVNLAKYDIEQQNTQNNTWQFKASTVAMGNGRTAAYRLNDVPTMYNNGYVIYRLKMIDKDGRFTYSPSVKINFKDGRAGLMLYGNPVTNNALKFLVTGTASTNKAEISVMDLTGKTLIKTMAPAMGNHTINIKTLAAGTYKLVVRIDGDMLQQTFIK